MRRLVPVLVALVGLVMVVHTAWPRPSMNALSFTVVQPGSTVVVPPTPIVIERAVPVQLPAPVVLHAAPEPTSDAPEPGGEQLGPCPRAFTRSTDVPLAELEFEPSGLAVSRWDVRLLAIHDDQQIVLSTDEGRSWTRVLMHDGMVEDVAFDCHGRLHAFRDTGEVGVFDDPAPTRWSRVGEFDGVDEIQLLPDAGRVVIVADDPGRPDQLLLHQPDARGRWRAEPLFADSGYGSWDGISATEIEYLGAGRYRALIVPWQGGECGYEEFFDVTFNVRTGRKRVIPLGDVPPPDYDDEPTPLSSVVEDAAGRTLGFDGEGQLVRLTADELDELLDDDPE